MSLALLVSFFTILFAPVIGVGFWARWLRRRAGVPRFAYRTADGLVAVAGLVVLVGIVFGFLVGHGAVSGESGGASQKARALAEGISEAMNCGALGFLIAVVAALWLAYWTWRRRRGSPRA